MIYGISQGGTFLAVVLIKLVTINCDDASVFEDLMRLKRRAIELEKCCNDSTIDGMLEKFPPIAVRHIVKLAEKEETLEAYCQEYERHLSELMDYSLDCCFDHRHHLVKQQIEGIEELYVTTCLNKRICKYLVQNSGCLYSVLETSSECLAEETENADVDPASKEMCPRLKAIINCFTKNAVERCSMLSATLLNKLFKRVVKATIRVDCGDCFHVRPDSEHASFDYGRMSASIIVLTMIVFSMILLRLTYTSKPCL